MSEQKSFRNFGKDSPPHVVAFYKENHEKQTLDFVLRQKEKFAVKRLELDAWGMLQLLDGIKDESDPDTQLSQMQHALQAAEAARRDPTSPDWFILAALIHDLGKALLLFEEPQWAVVGDTFPVGAEFSEKIVFHEFFAKNPDRKIPEFCTGFGVYHLGCGLDSIHFSWGHDEYLYRVLEEVTLPEEMRAIIRYHSAYPIHHEGGYRRFMSLHDHEMLPWIQRFQQFDLYSKDAPVVNVAEVKWYYQELIAKYLPEKLLW